MLGSLRLLALACLAGCLGGQVQTDDQPAATGSLIGGSATDERPEVGVLHNESDGVACTATLTLHPYTVLNELGRERRPDEECAMPCSGAPHLACGGEWLNSVYYAEAPPEPPAPPPAECTGACTSGDGQPGYQTGELGCMSCAALAGGCFAYPLPECGCALAVCGS